MFGGIIRKTASDIFIYNTPLVYKYAKKRIEIRVWYLMTSTMRYVTDSHKIILVDCVAVINWFKNVNETSNTEIYDNICKLQMNISKTLCFDFKMTYHFTRKHYVFLQNFSAIDPNNMCVWYKHNCILTTLLRYLAQLQKYTSARVILTQIQM